MRESTTDLKKSDLEGREEAEGGVEEGDGVGDLDGVAAGETA